MNVPVLAAAPFEVHHLFAERRELLFVGFHEDGAGAGVEPSFEKVIEKLQLATLDVDLDESDGLVERAQESGKIDLFDHDVVIGMDVRFARNRSCTTPDARAADGMVASKKLYLTVALPDGRGMQDDVGVRLHLTMQNLKRIGVRLESMDDGARGGEAPRDTADVGAAIDAGVVWPQF